MKVTILLLLVTALLLALPPAACAQWTNDPYRGMVPVCVDAANEWLPRLIAFDNGNYLVAWRNETRGLVGYQVLDPFGVPLLPLNGVPMLQGNWSYGWMSSSDVNPIMPDGDGGCIAVLWDNREGNWDIYGQCFDSLGNRLWGPTGLPIAIWPTAQDITPLDAASDSLGNFFVIYRVFYEGWVQTDLYVQKFDGEGTRLWGEYGAPLCTATGQQSDGQILADEQGGVFAVWPDARTGFEDFHLYGQHLNSTGTPLWGTDGRVLRSPISGSSLPVHLVNEGVPDGAGGGVWEYKPPLNVVCVFRLIDPGILAWMESFNWASNTVYCKILLHPTDGSIWLSTYENFGIYHPGYYLYSFNPLTGPPPYYLHRVPYGGYDMVPTSSGVVTINFRDEYPFRMWAGKINRSGAPEWFCNVAISQSASGGPGFPSCVSDGSEGMVCAFEDGANWQQMQGDIYAQRVLSNGQLGAPQPPLLDESGKQLEYGSTNKKEEFLRNAGAAKVELFDLLGRRVALLENERLPEGINSLPLNPANLNLPSGIYVVRMTTPTGQTAFKIALTR